MCETWYKCLYNNNNNNNNSDIKDYRKSSYKIVDIWLDFNFSHMISEHRD